MAINIEIRDIGTGRPVKPDFEPSIPKDQAINVRRRSSVESFRDLTQVNRDIARGTPREIGSKATKILRDFRAGKIDIKV